MSGKWSPAEPYQAGYEYGRAQAQQPESARMSKIPDYDYTPRQWREFRRGICDWYKGQGQGQNSKEGS